MILRLSSFVHILPVGDGRYLIVHAVKPMRLPIDKDVRRIVEAFAEPRVPAKAAKALSGLIPFSEDKIKGAIAGLVERQVLTEQTAEEELAAIGAELAPTHGRDPGAMLEQYRRANKEGADSYWSIGRSYGLQELGEGGKRVDAVLFGDCDIQMEADFLRREAATRGIDLRVAATFPDDLRFAAEHKHDVIFIGALRSRHMIAEAPPKGQAPHAAYIAEAERLLNGLRQYSGAPILIDNLPEPTVQPLGMAEHGVTGHRNRFRLANIALAELAQSLSGVHVVDVAAALAMAGSANMLDDGLFGFTHFGSPGWLLQRPEREKEAVHNVFPDIAPLAASVGGNPYGRESVLAQSHIDALVTILRWQQKKCVILDLDGTLWPGVLAETGSPFAWTPEISGGFSYIGLYFGLHEALLCLKKRGVVLACVSKNDEVTVRDLWKYPDHYPKNRLLSPDDFVTWRVNWNDKVDNIRSIADELGFALDSFLFIDNHPVERDRVRQRLPEVEVWGEDPFALRRQLLNDPRLQVQSITEEASVRSASVKAQLQRQNLRNEVMDEAAYRASLNIQTKIEKLAADSPRLGRVAELFDRTTQFNATGRKFSVNELAAITSAPASALFTIDVSDRFGSHGLVGAVVIENGEIAGLAMSCRTLGMGVESIFMRHILAAMKDACPGLAARIIETPRNIPVRNIYRDHGFKESEPGFWFHQF